MAPTPQDLPYLDEISNEASSLEDRVVISGVAGLFPSCHNVKDLNNILYNKVFEIITFYVCLFKLTLVFCVTLNLFYTFCTSR